MTNTKIIATRLKDPVEVVLKASAVCRDDPDLRQFRVSESSAAGECRTLIRELITGEAKRQVVVMVKLKGTGALLGVSSFRAWNLETVLDRDAPEWMRELAWHPYIGLLARDARYPNCILCDEVTPLSTVLLRAPVEYAATRAGGTPPEMFAFCRRNNTPSVRAFARNAFHPDPRHTEGDAYVLTRRAGLKMRAAPEAGAYIPWSATEGEAVAA
jgi:hypothetical protein